MTEPRLHVKALRLRVQTTDGEFGSDLEFTGGLNVLEARNSMGKSICLQSILYALGMEAMLGSRHDIPLPDAMRNELQDEAGKTLQVVESRVWLEVEGSEGRVSTLARWAKHESIDTRLVNVWDGPMLTQGGTYREHDHLVRMEGVNREVGLHGYLKSFIGWELPEILRTDGTEVPLYLEYVFPLLFVEQRGGWAGIQAQDPSFFVPEAKKRAVEFVLDLRVYERMKERLRLKMALSQVRSDWHSVRDRISARAQGSGFLLSGVPTDPVAAWPDTSNPGLVDAETDLAISSTLGVLREELEEIVVDLEEVPGETDEEVLSEMNELRSQLSVLGIATAELESEVSAEEETVNRIDSTTENLRRDLQRNKDASRLRDLGSESWAAEDEDCPTCHRPLAEVVLESSVRPVMTLEDNIAFIQSELKTFDLLSKETMSLIAVKREQLSAHANRLRELRLRMRDLRSTMTAGRQVPSAAKIGERIRLETRIDSLNALEQDVQEDFIALESLSSAWTEVSTQVGQIPTEEISADEMDKLEDLEARLVRQLEQYKFMSRKPSEVQISTSSYHPATDGAEISFGISASDGIRMIWAYLLGVLEVAREKRTHHPGFLIFDEPRQQSAGLESLAEFLARASESSSHDQQVILATSEEPEALREVLDGIDHTYIGLTGRLLRRLPT